MPDQSKHAVFRGYYPRRRAGTAFKHMAHQSKNSNLRPQQRGQVHRQFSRKGPNNRFAKPVESHLYKLGQNSNRGKVARLAAWFGEPVKKRTQYNSRQRALMSSNNLRVAGRKTKRRSKGKGRKGKGKGSKRRVRL